jgi:DtxR family transcriptional regulator, Mn-dependent transcriptional regulator
MNNDVKIKRQSGEELASKVQQEYLAEAYRLLQYQPADEPYISTSALAERVGVTAPAVAAIVERMKRAGYVEHVPYKGMRLTAKGEHEALMSIRRHRLAEVFLVKVMGFGWHDVHDEADDLGLSISDRMAARMEEMAGFPKRCPHGEPIPDANGLVAKVDDVLLAEMEAPANIEISRVTSHDPEVLKYLASLDLVPGKKIGLASKAPFGGPLRLKIDRQEQVIGLELSRIIRVVKA